MNEDSVSTILAVERDAARIHEEAQREATRMLADAEKAAVALRDQLMEQAQKQAADLVAASQAASVAERMRILSEAEAQATEVEAQAAEPIDRAVAYILSRIVPRV